MRYLLRLLRNSHFLISTWVTWLSNFFELNISSRKTCWNAFLVFSCFLFVMIYIASITMTRRPGITHWRYVTCKSTIFARYVSYFSSWAFDGSSGGAGRYPSRQAEQVANSAHLDAELGVWTVLRTARVSGTCHGNLSFVCFPRVGRQASISTVEWSDPGPPSHEQPVATPD